MKVSLVFELLLALWLLGIPFELGAVCLTCLSLYLSFDDLLNLKSTVAVQKQKSPNNIIGGICVCVDPNSSFFFFSASVSGVGKRKEVLEKRRGEGTPC